MSMSKQFLAASKILGASLLLTTLCGFELVYAAEAETADPSGMWNLIIQGVVLAVAAGSAVLPVSALKHWTGRWRLCAALPLLTLLVWVVIIIVSKLNSAESHQLWPFEIFAWAMITLIYMVTMMTAKRAFEKKDLEQSSDAQ